jgi:hypothetical protein
VSLVAPDTLEVQSDRPGTIHVRVTAQLASSAELVNDELALTYGEVSQLDVFRLRGDGLGATHPVILGTELVWCASAFGTGPDGLAAMALPDATAQFTVDGAILGAEVVDTTYDWHIPEAGLIGCMRVRAIAQGKGSVVVRYAAMERVIPLEVIDPSRVTSVSVHDLYSADERQQASASSVQKISIDELGMDPCSGSVIRIGTDRHAAQLYAWEFGLDDGRIAMGAASGMRVVPGGALYLAAEGRYRSSNGVGTSTGLFSVDALQSGTSAIELSAGTPTIFSVSVVAETSNLLYSMCDG